MLHQKITENIIVFFLFNRNDVQIRPVGKNVSIKKVYHPPLKILRKTTVDEVRGSPKMFSEEKKHVRSISDFVRIVFLKISEEGNKFFYRKIFPHRANLNVISVNLKNQHKIKK